MCSLKTPNKDLVELLVQSGAQLVVPGEEITALEIATREGQTDIVRYLASECPGQQWYDFSHVCMPVDIKAVKWSVFY